MTTQILTPATRQKRTRDPSWLKWFFRMPIGLYRIGLADQLGPSTLLLTTRGRKTGLWRATALNYLAVNDVTYVVAGHGPGSDWLKNLQADPHVHVQVGRRRFQAQAELLVDPAEHRRFLCQWVDRSLGTAPPPAVQRVLRRFGFDYDAAVRRHLEEDPPPRLWHFVPSLRGCKETSSGFG
jgi:deazaflavin-dependent oxidoreductase (nitroreductase family)